MITETELTVATVHARAVNITLERPVQTSGGEIPTAPLVLIDLETREGATGRAYVFSYTTFALEPLRQLVENLGKTLEGDAVQKLAPNGAEVELSRGGQPAWWWLLSAE